MKKYLLPNDGQFYKANLHCHTTISDGRLSPEEVRAHYKSLGYAIVAYTDHDILIPHPELAEDDFLPLNGFEVEVNEGGVDWPHTKTCHFCAIAKDPDNIIQPCYNEAYLFANAPKYRDRVVYDKTQPPYPRHYDPKSLSEMMKTIASHGFFITYNHPTWSREDAADYMGYEGMDAMELVNYSCQCAGHPDDHRVYDEMLRAGKRLFAVAADDNHNSAPLGSRASDSGGGFVMISAEKLEYRTVTSALARGDFYASEGPQIHALWAEDGRIFVRCSPADRVSLVSETRDVGVRYAENESGITEADFAIPTGAAWVRLTVTDAHGNHAYTRAYFAGEF